MTVIRGGTSGDVIALGLVDLAMLSGDVGRLLAQAQGEQPGERFLVGAVIFPAHRLDEVRDALVDMAADPEWGGEVVVP